MPSPSVLQRDCYSNAPQLETAPHLAHLGGCAAVFIVLVTVPRVSRSCTLAQSCTLGRHAPPLSSTRPEKDKRKGTKKVDIRLPGNGNSTPMAQGRSTEIISMIEWIRTSRLSIQISLSLSAHQKEMHTSPVLLTMPERDITKEIQSERESARATERIWDLESRREREGLRS